MTATTSTVHLVVDPLGRRISWAGVDEVHAHELARNTQQIVVALPVEADYRTDEQRQADEEGWAL